ncbi:arsenate reductase (glutaredoxin) [Caulobacter segnis]|uniref:Arsenate reductase n=2 Tax=Caulobacter segnis TaxID=88688 RepID=D5VK91_CAUST|nr:arsenate reductase (glutaredoxin) [Caulobacter segnis]ADG10914.1 arsenate reductase [Caulobacter segnis ATCC 21756]AVQ02612.1 arsenate reductase (glutaredoxin) [Caulobacter segnis]
MSDSDFPVVIYHNPNCGTSRNVLAMIRAAGYEPKVIEYLRTGWTHDQLQDLAKEAGLSFHQLMRTRGTPAEELGLTAEGVSEAKILEAMIAHPILVNRPLVVTPRGVKLCRPSEVVFDLLDRHPDSFTKEDGEVVDLSARP